MNCWQFFSTLLSLRLILRLACMTMGLICGFGIWFDGMSGGVCLLNHSTQACRLTLTTGLASWLIALIGIMATFRETSLEGNWASRVLFVDMVLSGFLAILWFACFADIGISYALSDPKEIGSAHVVAAFQTVVSLSFFSFIAWLTIALLCHWYWRGSGSKKGYEPIETAEPSEQPTHDDGEDQSLVRNSA